jgi:hypothetical protein
MEIQKKVIEKFITILINYDYLLIRCRFCLEVIHHVWDCPSLVVTKERVTKVSGQRGWNQIAQGVSLSRKDSGRGSKPREDLGKKQHS